LLACGRQVRYLGIVPTPTVQISIELRKAAGGISITASHNPEEWNGLKFINRDGIFFDLIENTKLWKAEKFADFNSRNNLFIQKLLMTMIQYKIMLIRFWEYHCLKMVL